MQRENSFRAVNLLFLIVLCLQASNLFFTGIPQYLRLILNEALFVFLPAYLYLRYTRQPVTERVRWYWPGWKIAVLSLLVGMGIYPLSAASTGIFLQLLGYTSFAAPPDAIPTTVLMSVLAVIAYVGMAPLCEEFLFRGVIQPVYETRGPKWGVLFVGFLFIAFHLSLLQGLSIILLSLALCYINYRTRSLPASILTHFGANFLAALVVTQGVFKTGIERWIVSAPAILGGLLVALLSLVALARLTRRPAVSLPAAEPSPTVRPVAPALLASSWPLLAALLVFLPLIGMEFYYSRSPELAAKPLRMGEVPWDGPQSWLYEISNVAETIVGDGECWLVPQGPVVDITCWSKVEAYEVKRGNSTFMSSGGERTDQLKWRTADGSLVSGATALSISTGEYRSEMSWELASDGIDIHMRVEGEAEKEVSLPFSETPLAKNSALLVAPDNSWPWQLAGIRLERGESGSVVRFNPNTWRNQTQDSGPVAENRLVTVVGTEEVTTPAGKFSAWKVTLGNDQTAWYALGGSRTLVKFFNGIETWALK